MLKFAGDIVHKSAEHLGNRLHVLIVARHGLDESEEYWHDVLSYLLLIKDGFSFALFGIDQLGN